VRKKKKKRKEGKRNRKELKKISLKVRFRFLNVYMCIIRFLEL
jgi:hypothetical protein